MKSALPRLHALEEAMRAEMAALYAEAATQGDAFFASPAFVPTLLRAAEVLELFGAVRSSAHSRNVTEVQAMAARLQPVQPALHAERARALQPRARALADALLLHGSDAAAAYAKRADALLARMDVPSLGSCAALAERVARCVQQGPRHRTWGACFTDVQLEPLRRVLRLTRLGDCVRDVAASMDDPFILHGFMMAFVNAGLSHAELAHLMLPPPAGTAPRVKSAHALTLAHDAFRILVAYPDGQVPPAQAERLMQLLSTRPNDVAADGASAHAVPADAAGGSAMHIESSLLLRAAKLVVLALVCYVVMRASEWLERQRRTRRAARRRRPAAAAARSHAD